MPETKGGQSSILGGRKILGRKIFGADPKGHVMNRESLAADLQQLEVGRASARFLRAIRAENCTFLPAQQPDGGLKPALLTASRVSAQFVALLADGSNV
jgi:hypothetical protein